MCLWCICDHYQNEIKKQENERKKNRKKKLQKGEIIKAKATTTTKPVVVHS